MSPRNKKGCGDMPDIMDGTGRGHLVEKGVSPQESLAGDRHLLKDHTGNGGNVGGEKVENISCTDSEASPFQSSVDSKKSPFHISVDSKGSPFQTVTIIDPENGASKPVGSSTMPILCESRSDPLKNNIGTDPSEGVEFELVTALFVFGGMNSSGYVHGDSFILVPF